MNYIKYIFCCTCNFTAQKGDGILRAKVDASTESVFNKGADNSSIFQYMISGIPTFFFRWLGYTSPRGWQ
uniref:Uncharacterized protein n=1 Tax=Glycine max TaxID=3847 RepID=A0A0R0ITA7_SOYBN